jgi:pyruvate dehydrogenase E1 component alpha subunit
MAVVEQDHELSKERLIWLYETIAGIRRFEERVHEIFQDGELPGFVHLCAGQEAIAAGVCAHLGPEDFVWTTHRNHGHNIAKGVEFKPMMAELYARETGTNRGKGGSMHIADRSKGVMAGNGIVAAGPPLALGTALSAKLRGTGQVTACFFSDGAAQQGTTHEAMNLAAIWDLPVIFVCENNGFAQATPVSYSSPVDLASRGEAYGIPGVSIDGQDVFEVYETAGVAVDRARSGEGPTLIEAKTWSYLGAWEGEPKTGYRSREVAADFRRRDPFQTLPAEILARGMAEQSELDQILANVEAGVEEAVEFARNSPSPEPEDCLNDVYVGNPDALISTTGPTAAAS